MKCYVVSHIFSKIRALGILEGRVWHSRLLNGLYCCHCVFVLLLKFVLRIYANWCRQIFVYGIWSCKVYEVFWFLILTDLAGEIRWFWMKALVQYAILRVKPVVEGVVLSIESFLRPQLDQQFFHGTWILIQCLIIISLQYIQMSASLIKSIVDTIIRIFQVKQFDGHFDCSMNFYFRQALAFKVKRVLILETKFTKRN